ncbi:ABC transporter substrate-binding protein [Plantibacter sp. MMLR14_011]|uniref:ABC transporter substrate-binding protein n=1 Tax=Plantibacter sp. MMLR14_011 TaxID=1898746 RepID=UPI0008DCEF42|nr:ABC transporter substrate-binding protein [Plantibacter sp. MMLR14_011]OII39919.1 hypothetical protein BIU99_05655 [Plantibacter sp. MMLR14_011]
MKSTRSVAVALTTAAILGASLTACSGGGAEIDPKTVTVLSNVSKNTASGRAFFALFDQFKQDTGISVEVIEQGDDTNRVYETTLAGGREAQLVLTNRYQNLDWLQNGSVVDAKPYADEWGITDRLKPDAVDAWSDADGGLMGIPLNGYTWPVMYNTELLQQAGFDAPPTTTDELLQLASALRAKGITPWAIGGSDWSGEKLFAQIAQTHVSADEAAQLFTKGGWCDSDAAKQGIDDFVALRDGGVFVDKAEGYTVDLAQTDFYTGKAAIYSDASWGFGNVPEEIKPNVVIGGVPVPADSDFTGPSYYSEFGSGLWISPNGEKNLDAVGKLVTFLLSDEAQERLVAEASLVSPLTTDFSAAATDPLLQQALGLSDTGQRAVLPDDYVADTATTTWAKATAGAYAESASTSDICAALDAALAE